MKVLHVIPSVSPLRGGPSKAVFGMVQALRRHDVEASILTTNDHGPGIDPSLPTGRWCQREGVPLLAFPRWSPPLRPLREFAISPGLVAWLRRHVRDYDLLHVHAIFSFPSTWSMAQARRSGVPYVVRTIGQLSPWSLSQSPARKRWMLRLVERRNLDAAAALHFTSRAERDEAAALGLLPPPLLVPLGVSAPDPQPRIPGREGSPVRFLFLSRLHPKKGLHRLVKALAILQARQPGASWSLSIAGSGAAGYEDALRSLIRQGGIEERCQWLGHLQGPLKTQQLCAADWLVLPSAGENFGIVVAEALACGTPVILSPEVAIADLVKAAGAGLICSSEPEALARCLEQALRRPPASMRQAALNLTREHLDWSAIAEELRNAYTTILTPSTP